jgi:hypothetical protein
MMKGGCTVRDEFTFDINVDWPDGRPLIAMMDGSGTATDVVQALRDAADAIEHTVGEQAGKS